MQIAYRNIAIAPGRGQGEGRQHDQVDQLRLDRAQRHQRGRAAAGSPPKDFGEGGTFEIKVDKPGVIHYECTIHPATMNGTIEVVS